MAAPTSFVSSVTGAWEVFTLFLIPIGGGIPAGVLLAQSRSIGWPVMLFLYFVSDVVLACAFEPLMKFVISAGKRSKFIARFNEALKKSTKKTIPNYGTRLGPLALIMVSFSVDPMTGRTVTVAAGHGFVSGWLLAIAGDMLFFTLIMVSTIWLHNILGDGTWATVVILVVMMGVPYLVRKVRDARRVQPS